MSTSRHNPWFVLRDVPEVDSVSYESHCGQLTLPTGAMRNDSEFVNAIEIMMAAAGNEEDTITFTLWAGRNGRGPGRKVCNGTFILGTQAFGGDPSGKLQGTPLPTRYGSSLALTESWLKPVKPFEESDDNLINGFYFDLLGYDWLYCEINDKAATVTRMVFYYSYV